MRSAFQIAAKDLKLRVRDRSAFIIGILAPLVLAFIFNLVFGSAASGTGFGLEYGLVDQDNSQISETFRTVLEEAESTDVLTLELYDDRAQADAGVDAGDIDAYIFIPVGFEKAVNTNQSSTIEVIGDIDSPTSTEIAASFADQFSTAIATGQIAIGTTPRRSEGYRSVQSWWHL